MGAGLFIPVETPVQIPVGFFWSDPYPMGVSGIALLKYRRLMAIAMSRYAANVNPWYNRVLLSRTNASFNRTDVYSRPLPASIPYILLAWVSGTGAD